tara:strand:+ start:12148 stop:12360 length:213 start_codon:yes stop_codon:yes gene_type:complete
MGIKTMISVKTKADVRSETGRMFSAGLSLHIRFKANHDRAFLLFPAELIIFDFANSNQFECIASLDYFQL